MTRDIKKKLTEFFEKYKDYLEEDDLDYACDNLDDYLSGSVDTDVISQVAYAIGEHPNFKTRYEIFLDFLKDNNGLDKDILEVACGGYPILSDMIDKEQTKIGKGSITGIDPLLMTTNLGNIHLFRENFTLDTDVSGYQLITGHYPCEATLDIIRSANEADKDFTIALCGCTHLDGFYMYMPGGVSYLTWMHTIDKVAQDTKKPDRIVDFVDVDGLEYPILLSKKKTIH